MIQRSSTFFLSDGVPLIGQFFRPDSAVTPRRPAIIVAGSWLNVKEQMASGYAEKLAERGYITFVFDFAGWGESGGALRHTEIPMQKARDLAAAARFVASHASVDPDRVAFLGVCASAQYGLRALAEGAHFSAFASVAGWFHDAPSVAPFYGGEGGVQLRRERAALALRRFVQTGELSMVPAYAPNDDRAGMHFELDYYGNRSRGAVPSWNNEMAEISWLHWLEYDGISPSGSVRTPTLVVHSDGCALPDNAKRVYAALAGAKKLAWLDGAQQDYYDQPAQMTAAMDHVCAWFDESMK